MTRSFFRILIIAIAILCVLGVGAFLLLPSSWKARKNRGESQPRVVIPRGQGARTGDEDNLADLFNREETVSAKIGFGEGEVIVAVLNGDFDGGDIEKQFVAYRNLLEIDSPVYLTFIDYDETTRSYKRLWDAQTAATRPGTISLYTMDLLGDRSVCVLLSGVNGLGEHTLTVFRKNTPRSREQAGARAELFSKIAELRIDGTIVVKEVERSQAYQMGYGRGASFAISGYGRDFESSNILDQVEITYAYNTGNGLYEQSSRTRIPGAQVEQRRVREILGNSKAFEEFISGLWYHTTPQGTINKQQYIYFNPPGREIIFYGDETQQVFNWQGSAATRYGLYISSQNISISTLRRTIDLELETLDSIRVRVFEDVRLKIGVNAAWDGSYRKAGPLERQDQKPMAVGNAYINASYDGSIGKIHFSSDGSYELNSAGTVKRGKYAFFAFNNQEFLELRSIELRPEGAPGTLRETYLLETEQGSGENRKTLTLLRVRLGSRGIERLHEGAISLTLAAE